MTQPSLVLLFSAAAGDDAKKYPSSNQHPRDWDKVVANINEDEKNEKLEGDAALNQLFQQIYSDGTDEVKKAMNKSFVSPSLLPFPRLFFFATFANAMKPVFNEHFEIYEKVFYLIDIPALQVP